MAELSLSRMLLSGNWELGAKQVFDELRRVKPALDENFGNVPSTEEDDGMAIFPNLLIRLSSNHGGGHQHPKLPMADTRN